MSERLEYNRNEEDEDEAPSTAQRGQPRSVLFSARRQMVQVGHAPDPGASHRGNENAPGGAALASGPLPRKEVKSSGQGLPQWQCSFEDLNPLQGRISLPSWPRSTI
jgi:hypothetical protein